MSTTASTASATTTTSTGATTDLKTQGFPHGGSVNGKAARVDLEREE